MKLHQLLILSGLLIGAAPSLSFADCRPACGDGFVCSVTKQGPPTVYGCTKEKATYDVRKPGAVKTVGGGAPAGGGVAGGSLRSGTVQRASDPKLAEATAAQKGAATITSPRDPASGQATGKPN